MHFLFVEPKTIVLDRAPNGKADTMEYVPLCEVLKWVLENVTPSGDFSTPLKVDNYFCSVFDGSAFSEHKYFVGDINKICLQLYSDEFEVCNPLGSKRGTHTYSSLFLSAEFQC